MGKTARRPRHGGRRRCLLVVQARGHNPGSLLGRRGACSGRSGRPTFPSPGIGKANLGKDVIPPCSSAVSAAVSVARGTPGGTLL